MHNTIEDILWKRLLLTEKRFIDLNQQLTTWMSKFYENHSFIHPVQCMKIIQDINLQHWYIKTQYNDGCYNNSDYVKAKAETVLRMGEQLLTTLDTYMSLIAPYMMDNYNPNSN